MSDFPSTLKSKIDEKGLNATDAAAAIGVSLPSLRTALSGKSFPNARSLGKYASFLGLGEAETKALIAASKPAPGTKKAKEPKAPKAPKAAKVKGAKRGRKPGVKNAVKTGAKPGRKAGSTKGSTGAAAALATIAASLKAAEGLAGDALALAVHKLGKTQRTIVESILKSLG